MDPEIVMMNRHIRNLVLRVKTIYLGNTDTSHPQNCLDFEYQIFKKTILWIVHKLRIISRNQSLNNFDRDRKKNQDLFRCICLGTEKVARCIEDVIHTA